MINASEKLQEVRLISSDVAEYIDAELYRFDRDKDIEWSQEEILSYCIPILVSELQELGIHIALDETDYLTEFTYMDGIIALRKLLDKENIPVLFKSNPEYIDLIKSVSMNTQTDDEDLIKDFLELLDTKSIGDDYQLERISYISDYVYSTVSFRTYINYMINETSDIKVDTVNVSDNIELYKTFAATLDDNVMPLWNQALYNIVNLGIKVDDSIAARMKQDYVHEYIASEYTKNYVYLFSSTDEYHKGLALDILKDIRVRLQTVLPYSITNYLTKKDSYTLLTTSIHYGTMAKLYRINSDPDENIRTEEYVKCYDVLKHSVKLSVKRDIELILESIQDETHIGTIISGYLEGLLGTV